MGHGTACVAAGVERILVGVVIWRKVSGGEIVRAVDDAGVASVGCDLLYARVVSVGESSSYSFDAASKLVYPYTARAGCWSNFFRTYVERRSASRQSQSSPS